MAGPWGDLRYVFVLFAQPKTFGPISRLLRVSVFSRVCDMLASKQGNAS